MSSKRLRNAFCGSAKKAKKKRKRTVEFCNDKANLLALSDKGSYFNQEELLRKELHVSASAKKIQHEIEDIETDVRREAEEANILIQDGGRNFERPSQLTMVDPMFLENAKTYKGQNQLTITWDRK